MSQINEDTELVIIDEWSKETMTSDVVKTMLQGECHNVQRILR